jgi:seryl-tRNA synthetase
MHNLKEFRNNLDILKKKFKNRNVDFDANNFKKKDTFNRDLISKKEKLEQ